MACPGPLPVALRAEAGVAVHFINALGPVLAAVSPAVIQVLTAVVACVAGCALTPGGGQGGRQSARGLWVLCVWQRTSRPCGSRGSPGYKQSLGYKDAPACPGTLLYGRRELVWVGELWVGRVDT